MNYKKIKTYLQNIYFVEIFNKKFCIFLQNILLCSVKIHGIFSSPSDAAEAAPQREEGEDEEASPRLECVPS